MEANVAYNRVTFVKKMLLSYSFHATITVLASISSTYTLQIGNYWWVAGHEVKKGHHGIGIAAEGAVSG